MASTKVELTSGEQVQGTLPVANGGTGGNTQSAARTGLALVPGTDVQAHSSILDTWATKAAPSGTPVGTSDTQALTNKDLSGAGNVFPTSLATTSQVAPSVYTTTIGNGASTSFTINHNLNTRNLTITVYNASTYEVVQCDRTLTDANNVTLGFQTAPSTGAYAVVILGGALISQPSVFTQTIGDSTSTVFTITHNLGTRSVNVNVYDASTYKMVHPDRALTTTNSVTITFQSAPATNAYVVVVQGGILSSTGVVSGNITDATTIGRSLLTASSAASALALLTPLQGAQGAVVATSESTSSTTYADLTTTTDQVTVTIGPSGLAIVFISGAFYNATASTSFYVSFALSGATTQAASDALSFYATNYLNVTPPPAGQFNAPFLLTGLTPGSTTFKMKYRVSGGTGQFAYRRIAAIPL